MFIHLASYALVSRSYIFTSIGCEVQILAQNVYGIRWMIAHTLLEAVHAVPGAFCLGWLLIMLRIGLGHLKWVVKTVQVQQFQIYGARLLRVWHWN